MYSIEEHISNQIHKIYVKSGVLRRIRRFVPKNVTLRLYKSFISPHLDYCFPLLLGGWRVQVNRVKDANHDIPRSLLGSANLFYRRICYVLI